MVARLKMRTYTVIARLNTISKLNILKWLFMFLCVNLLIKGTVIMCPYLQTILECASTRRICTVA